MTRKLALFAVLLVTPAIAQPEQATGSTVDDPRALLLKVATGPEFDQSGDPAPARRLAVLFAEGRGVEQDAALACTFAIHAANVTAMTPPRRDEDLLAYDARLKDGRAFSERYCSGLSPNESIGAYAAVGCFAVGMPREIITLDGVSILVDRTGIGLVDRPLRAGLPNCPLVVSSVRPVSAAPAFGAPAGLRPRHFVEALYWIRGVRNGTPTFVLHLYLQELEKETLESILFEPLLESTVWPSREIDVRSWYDLQSDGRVRYEVAGAIEKRGWIENRGR
jgi:hypothetical protein